ncbi:hypothetical protein A9179_09520 [Pseudomonas alcaligenes]|uniref:Uncharacterized protein n=1 Tax=Aquipseudomonas alcaligenes TaxID=43263 RepID=A0ABR7RYV3_AQUAC|nr:hypothetical protein [Pseudomonas alcaligenes]MBC9250510.1 hypothetical protein [Pseudomonas alcaligenes]
MLRMDVGGLTERLSLGLQRQERREAGEMATPEEVSASLRVSLSELGRIRSTAKNDDIDDSDLPDTIKEILKTIRALKQQIAEKQAELEALMAEPGLDAETRRARAEALQMELSELQSALSNASVNLLKAMREAQLSDEQMQTATQLAMR